jgi:heme/copper-type cytochrome/quinol oxidase subunit 2
MVGSMEVITQADFDTWFKGQTEGALKANQKLASNQL